MYVLLGSLIAMNAAAVTSYVAPVINSFVSDAVEYLFGKSTVLRARVLARAAKVLVMRRLGYYGSIQAVYLHSNGQRREVTREVLRLDPVTAKSEFITSSSFFMHELGCDALDELEVHGLDKMGFPFKFVFDWDSEIAVPLMCNLDNPKLVDKSVISATAIYKDREEDCTSLVREWGRCCSLERCLGYIARDFLRQSDDLWDAICTADADDRFELHLMYYDLSVVKMVHESPSRLLLHL